MYQKLKTLYSEVKHDLADTLKVSELKVINTDLTKMHTELLNRTLRVKTCMAAIKGAIQLLSIQLILNWIRIFW